MAVRGKSTGPEGALTKFVSLSEALGLNPRILFFAAPAFQFHSAVILLNGVYSLVAAFQQLYVVWTPSTSSSKAL